MHSLVAARPKGAECNRWAVLVHRRKQIYLSPLDKLLQPTNTDAGTRTIAGQLVSASPYREDAMIYNDVAHMRLAANPPEPNRPKDPTRRQ